MPGNPRDSHVNQEGASAGGDIVAGNKVSATYIVAHPNISVIEKLLLKLQTEMAENIEVKETIEQLRHFHKKRTGDGVDGLEAKLLAGGREHETIQALEKKELFAKVLERFSLYASAQEIFVHLLAKAEYEFQAHVYPQIEELVEHKLNQVVTERIIEPIVNECGATVLQMHHGVAMGMMYWLAEQCFIRWHK